MSFNIEFDYRFAPEGAFDDLAKQRLEEAARIWEWFINDEFPDIPAGTEITVFNPTNDERTTIELDQPIDDLLIFVEATSDPDITTTAAAYPSTLLTTGEPFDSRINGPDYQPWVGTIIFSTELNGFANIALAIHEIGHILGITTSVPIFSDLVDDDLFNGPTALAVNNGNPIPVSGSHIDSDFDINGQSPVVNEFGVGDGLPSIADLAILKDIGYDIPVLSRAQLPTQLNYYRQGTDEDDSPRSLRTLGGNDFLDGKGGQDQLQGGDGKDTFFFTPNSNNDTIVDFTVNDDTIQISKNYGFTSPQALANRVERRGTSTFNGREGIWSELTLATDHIITLYHDAPLTSANFLISDRIPTPPLPDPIPGTQNNDELNGTPNGDRIVGKSGNDNLFGRDGSDTLLGGKGRDRLVGGTGDDVLKGGGDRDRLIGSKGNDRLLGGSDKDTLKGGAGDDVLRGQKGGDRLFGGAGQDIFALAAKDGRDKIMDFELGQDSIQLLGNLSSDRLSFITKGDNTLIKDDNQNLVLVVGFSASEIQTNSNIFI